LRLWHVIESALAMSGYTTNQMLYNQYAYQHNKTDRRMTENTKKIIDEFEKELEELPEDEQEGYAKSLLQDLRRRKQKKEREPEEGQVQPYASFQVLKDAKLEGQPDESTTYEDALYGLSEDG